MVRTYLSPEEIFEVVDPLISDLTGLVRFIHELPQPTGYPDIVTYTSQVSEVSHLHDYISTNDGDVDLSGSGSSDSRQMAQAKAYCEALERYCNSVYNEDDLVTASRDEMGDKAVDLNRFYRGSPEEYDHPHPNNFMLPPDNSRPMRWMKGHSLITGETKYVPFSTIYISSTFRYAGEAFTLPITTGTALAAGYEKALVAGICEVIERDSLMLTWLQRLPLPRIDVSNVQHAVFQDRLKRILHSGLEQYFFDATTDLGVPTIYSLQIDPKAEVAALVMAATKLNAMDGLIRVLDESAPSRLAIANWSSDSPIPKVDDYRQLTRLQDGAIFYSDPRNLDAFDFLFDHSNETTLDAIPNLETGDVRHDLDNLVNIFAERNMELVAVDLTVPPLRDSSLYVTKVIAPELIPLAVNHNQRFTMTPRLYDAPKRMGYPIHDADNLNPYPQPFA